MTLIELLVVMGILLLLAVLTIPKLRPEMEKARVREAARSIQLYLGSARALAMATGRSCGVMIEPLSSENGCSMQLSQVETPLPYSGDFTTSTATVVPQTDACGGTCKITLSSATSVQLHQGDQFQFGYQGYWLLLDTCNPNPIPAGTTTLTAGLDMSHGEMPAWLNQSGGITGPYKIWRWPVKSAATALELPSPAVIDLTWSGTDPVGGSSPTWTIGATPILIMFSSDGKIDWVASNTNPTGAKVTTPIYLLVGRRDKVIDPPNGTDTTTNLNDYTSLWVAINPSTGMVGVYDLGTIGTSNAVLTPSNNDSRYFARKGSTNGG